MILYTIYPLEMVLEEESEEQTQEVEIKAGSVSLMCQCLPGGEMKISRVISTNPQDYLNPQWQPGKTITR
ncbi:MAG TPA: YlzJ-like family protein [Bacillota bacterium]|nr:YlzJ-like family protein [Bacillota bacterium]HPT87515.1 YlzJ-like family protein [Bacillota bacterium]